MSIGERITSLRTAASLSQGQLADRMGVSRQAVSKWENDLSCPDPLRLIQLADALGTDVEYLASGVSHSPPAPPEPIVIRQVEEKPVYIEKAPVPPAPKVVTVTKEIPVERIVEKVVEKPVVKVKKVVRVQYRTNKLDIVLACGVGLIIGILIGLLF